MNRIKVFYPLYILLIMITLLYSGCSEVRDDIVLNSTSDLGECSRCHGNSDHPYPPRDLSGRTDPSVLTVGSHDKHLNPNTARISRAVECGECHDPVTSFHDPSHIGSNPDNRAEIVFGPLARTVLPGDPNTPDPQYDGLGGCSGVYCHGNFKQGNRNAVPVFNDPSSVVCGSCHGDPATGNPNPGAPNNFQSPHFSYWTIQNCVFCHGTVMDENGNIINASLHVNGQVNGNLP